MAHGRKSGGFTLIEILVIVGITALLSSSLILYSSSSRQQLALYAEETKFIQAAYRAKSLSLALYAQLSPPDVCGYGIHVDADSYYIFSYDKPAGSTCEDINDIDLSRENQISVFNLDSNVKFMNPRDGVRFSDVLFIPPDPTTLIKDISGNVIENGSRSLIIQTRDSSLSAAITVNSSGLIDLN